MCEEKKNSASASNSTIKISRIFIDRSRHHLLKAFDPTFPFPKKVSKLLLNVVLIYEVIASLTE